METGGWVVRSITERIRTTVIGVFTNETTAQTGIHQYRGGRGPVRRTLSSASFSFSRQSAEGRAETTRRERGIASGAKHGRETGDTANDENSRLETRSSSGKQLAALAAVGS